MNNNELVNKIIPVTDPYKSQIGIQYSGQPYLTGYVPELIQSDVSALMRFGILIMVFILLANLKSFKAKLFPRFQKQLLKLFETGQLKLPVY